MHITHIVRQFAPAVGGMEMVVAGLCQALQVRGHTCSVLTLNRLLNADHRRLLPAHENLHGVPVTRLPWIGSRRYPIAPTILKHLSQAEVVHLHGVDFFLDYLALFSSWHQKPLVINTYGGFFHTRWNLALKRWWLNTITRLSLRRVRAIVGLSRQDDAVFEAIVPAAKRHVLGTGVAIEPFLALTKNITPGLILGIGRTAVNKRIECVVQTLAAILPDCPTAQLVWLGPEGGETASVLALAHQLGVAERVRLLGDVPQADMLTWLTQAQVFVSASDYESFGISTIEAMASGTVPVATAVGVHPEVIVPDQTGWLWKPNQPHILRQALATPIETLLQMGQAARAIAHRYAWEVVVERYLQVYTQVLNG